jgi:hypothetical protein
MGPSRLAIYKAEAAESKEDEPPAKKNRQCNRTWTCTENNISADMTNEEMENAVAFCCFRCHCDDEKKSKIPADDCFAQSGEGGLYHRRCCHGLIGELDPLWCCQFEEAVENLMNGKVETNLPVVEEEMTIEKWELYNRKIVKSREAAFCQRDDTEGLSILFVSALSIHHYVVEAATHEILTVLFSWLFQTDTTSASQLDDGKTLFEALHQRMTGAVVLVRVIRICCIIVHMTLPNKFSQISLLCSVRSVLLLL